MKSLHTARYPHDRNLQNPDFAPNSSPMEPSSSAAAAAAAAESPPEAAGEDSVAAAGIWDWGNLLDFTIEVDEEPFAPSWDPNEPPLEPPPEPHQSRSRKRDPRLVCENYLAGRVPCACPELDRKAEEEEEEEIRVSGGRGKKVRVSGPAGGVRCQVTGCGADISGLKGYHRRHRVCLRCANAGSVFMDGEFKRYCQQCGKFHLLPDFDEGKRSCRRKLERHNRRRRRSVDRVTFVEMEKEPLLDLAPVIVYEEEQTKEAVGIDISVEAEERDTSPALPNSSLVAIYNKHSTIGPGSEETPVEEKTENTKPSVSSSYEDKIAYSSLCPTGRVSFKLYDWNPADFPRRLRHQIFQWLSSMPVELEGYIRPGCVILTFFIAMPRCMWDKLSKESNSYVNDLLKSPLCLFSGKGNMFIDLNNKIFQVMPDGTFSGDIRVEVQGPKIHYVYPNCFEAGKSIELILCGSNLLLRKFRLLVSFFGKYLTHEFCAIISPQGIKPFLETSEIGIDGSDHQMLLVRLPPTDADIHGPAFIEVENDCGTSNFVPILLGSCGTCAEMTRLQELVNGTSLTADVIRQSIETGSAPHICEVFAAVQASTSDLLVDAAWLTQKSTLQRDDVLHSQRVNHLRDYLRQSGSFACLEDAIDRSTGATKMVNNSRHSTGIDCGARRAWVTGFPGRRGGAARLVLLTMAAVVTCFCICAAIFRSGHYTGGLMRTVR